MTDTAVTRKCSRCGRDIDIREVAFYVSDPKSPLCRECARRIAAPACFDTSNFYDADPSEPVERSEVIRVLKAAAEMIEAAQDLIGSGGYDVLVLEEVNELTKKLEEEEERCR